jgi:D-alanyl-D-alanine carboxypeptidase
MDDIPEARRESASLSQDGKAQSRSPFLGYGLLAVGTGAIAVSIIGAVIAQPDPQAIPWAPQLADVATIIGAPPNSPEESPTLLGHRAYGEVPVSQLVPVPSAPLVQLQPAAAEAVEAMVIAAQAEGINLLPLSGFRSHADQQYLFFQIKADLGESAISRAEVSAPPGYSEHHTGYAVDFGDSSQPSTHVQTSFEQTPAFEWLQQNAPRYNFELSFPKNGENGVAYEPWHWRFVGDSDSLETFYQAR